MDTYSTECVGHVSVEVVLISSGVDVFLGAEKLNSSSEEQETDNTPITRPSMSYSLCTYVQCTYSTTWIDTYKTQHTTHVVPSTLHKLHTHTHTLFPPSTAHTRSYL